MKLDIICNDGSPLGVTLKSLYGEDGRIGVGGAENALLTMCEGWHKAGHEITLYNSPNVADGSPFPQRGIDDFRPEDERDYLIIFRSPNHRANGAKGKKIWWSTDQATVGDFKAFSYGMDKIVTISKFHSDHFKNIYGITNTVSIDLPVRTWEYKDEVQKVPKQCLFSSVPDRGLMPLHAAWARIVRDVPDANLVITSDWRLWSPHIDEGAVRQYRLAFAHQPNVTYLSAVNRKRLVEEQMKSAMHLYPGVYDELFCISVAESQVAGAFPITSNYGALGSTNMGMVISGNPTDPKWIEVFVAKAAELLNDNKLIDRQKRIRNLAMKRFSLDKILEQWAEKVFNA